jgi:uncharacterized protein
MPSQVVSAFSDPFLCLAAVVAVTLSGLSKGGLGGFGLLATPVLALVIPPVQAAAVLLPIMLIQDMISVWIYRRDWDHWNLTVLVPGGIVGIGLAWWLAAYISDGYVRLAVGGIALAFALSYWFGSARPRIKARPAAFPGVIWGAVSGFAGTLAHAGGPPFQVYVLPQRLERVTYVGTMAFFFAAINAVKVAPYFALGQFSARGVTISAALLPLAVLANLLGVWLVRIAPTELFYRITYALVFLVSLELIRQGLTDILSPRS